MQVVDTSNNVKKTCNKNDLDFKGDSLELCNTTSLMAESRSDAVY